MNAPTGLKKPVLIRTPEHRLRVFISSTLVELAEERRAVRQAIGNLRLAPVMFESGARPHPAQQVYQAYLAQSHIFIGIYWQRYGWVAPGMSLSGLEDEYNLSADLPRLFYIKDPAIEREPGLSALLERIQRENSSSYKHFSTPEELSELVENDLALMLAEYFETARGEGQASCEIKPQPVTNVPIPRNLLVGRERELEVACDLLGRDDVALVTLTGAGGAGKSRLGIQIALAMRDRFPDGVYLVGLESIQDAALVISTIAKVLGVTESAGGEPLIDTLKGCLCSREILILLDNFEQVMPAAPQIAELLEACPHVKLVVTSRAPLRLRAEWELPVPPLAIPPLAESSVLKQLSQYSAVRLFIHRAQSVKPDFQVTNENAAAVAEICHRLEGLPLAIELASARIKMLSPQVLLSRLGRRFEVLRGGTRDLPERQRTLFSAIDWSYNLLLDEDKRLLRRLSVFAGGWTLEEAEAVCSLPEEGVLDVFNGLETLCENNLIQPPEEVDGELRFKMLESIREFVYDCLVSLGEAEIFQDNHARYYLSFAEKAEGELHRSAQQAWHGRLETELDNLRGAMRWALEHSLSEYTLRIAMSLWRFWWTHGYWREGLQWLEKGLAGEGPIPVAVRAKALARIGWLTRELGDNDRGIATLQQSLALWREIDDPAGIALTLNILGTTVMHKGDYSGAMSMLEEALKIRREINDEMGIRVTLMNLGLVAFEQGFIQRSVDLYSESVERARRTGDENSIAICLTNLGEAYAHQDDYERAEACYAEAALIYQKLGSRAGSADVLRNRGLIALKQGHLEQAFDLLAGAITVLHGLGDKDLTLLALEEIAIVIDEQADPGRALRLLSAGEALRISFGTARAPVDQVSFDACVQKIQGQLSVEAFAKAWAEGKGMSFDQVIDYAVT